MDRISATGLIDIEADRIIVGDNNVLIDETGLQVWHEKNTLLDILELNFFDPSQYWNVHTELENSRIADAILDKEMSAIAFQLGITSAGLSALALNATSATALVSGGGALIATNTATSLLDKQDKIHNFTSPLKLTSVLGGLGNTVTTRTLSLQYIDPIALDADGNMKLKYIDPIALDTNGNMKLKYDSSLILDSNGNLKAASADKLTTARNINGVAFDGTGNITIPVGSSQWTTNGTKIHYNTGNVGIDNNDPFINLSVGGTNANHKMGRAIINANSIHNADKRDTFQIGRWDGTSTVNEFLGMNFVVATGANSGETTDNHAFISFNTWGNAIANSREVMRINQRGRLGIGKTNPTEQLDVVGNAIISGSLITNSINGTTGVNVSYTTFGVSTQHKWYNGTTNTMTLASGGGLSVSGGFIGKLIPNNDTWHQSVDSKNRFWFSTNDRTYFGSPNGYVWRSSTDTVDVMTLTNAGALSIPNTLSSSTHYIGNTYLQDGLLSFVNNSYTAGKIQFGIGDWQTYAGSYIQAVASQGGISGNRMEFYVNPIGGTSCGYHFTGSSVGINTLPNSSAKLAIDGSIRIINGGVIEMQNGANYKYYFGVSNNESDGDEVNFTFWIWQISSGTWRISSYIEDDTTWGNSLNPLIFTGQHRCVSDDKHIYSSDYIGYIVSSDGKYKNMSSKYGRNNIKQNIEINNALPYVSLTSKPYDKKVYGVISDRYDDENDRFTIGKFVSVIKKDRGDKRLIVNGCGEGSIWVSNYNGNLENGDYIVSSSIPGIGMRQTIPGTDMTSQSDDLLHNYTVAKITMDCNFDPQLIPVEIIKQEVTIDVSGNEISNNVLDEDENPIYEYKLDSSNNVIYEYEYEMKTVVHNGIEYKMAFVGAVYKCS